MIIGAFVLLYFGINYLKGLNVLQGRNVYYAVYPDVSGINDASPVLFHGMKVGQVIGTELLPDGSGNVAVAFQVNDDRLVLNKGCKAEIYSSDLFTRAIQIVMGEGAPSLRGDTLSSGAQASLTESVGQQLDPIKRKMEVMLANVDSVLSSVQLVLSDKAIGDIDGSLSSLRGTLQNIQGTTQRLNAILDAETASINATLENLNKVSTTLANNSDELNRIFANADSLMAALGDGRLEKMLANLNGTSEQLKLAMTKVNEGKGTLGKLLKDDSLYNNMNEATRELDLLLEDLRLNPNRYLSIFGKKDRLPKLSDADIERIQQSYQKQPKP
ncbi:MAG: MCE family protein [Flavobacteriales bacterium]|nr:MCE family protein [Flavobacteriales bacterium]